MLHSNERTIKHKLGLLNPAEGIGNVSNACQVMGLSRDAFYRYRDAPGSSPSYGTDPGMLAVGRDRTPQMAVIGELLLNSTRQRFRDEQSPSGQDCGSR